MDSSKPVDIAASSVAGQPAVSSPGRVRRPGFTAADKGEYAAKVDKANEARKGPSAAEWPGLPFAVSKPSVVEQAAVSRHAPSNPEIKPGPRAADVELAQYLEFFKTKSKVELDRMWAELAPRPTQDWGTRENAICQAWSIASGERDLQLGEVGRILNLPRDEFTVSEIHWRLGRLYDARPVDANNDRRLNDAVFQKVEVLTTPQVQVLEAACNLKLSEVESAACVTALATAAKAVLAERA